MVEVFKTNVADETNALLILKQLQQASAHYKVNFDLLDCDKILRIESNQNIDIRNVIRVLQQYGFQREILPDHINFYIGQ